MQTLELASQGLAYLLEAENSDNLGPMQALLSNN